MDTGFMLLLVGAVSLYSTGHPVGGSVLLLVLALGTFRNAR